jgi:parvulin-like peptidyl-prolyl isomerase
MRFTRSTRLLASLALLSGALAFACVQHDKKGKAGTAKKVEKTQKGKKATGKATKPAAKPHKQKSKAKVPQRPPRPTKLTKRPPRKSELAGSHILIGYKGARRAKATRSKDEALKLAKKLTAQLVKAPNTFAAAAKKHSEGPSGKKGGDLGAWRQGRMVPAFDKAIQGLKVGQISKEPVETPFGYHVMKRNPLPPYVAGAHLLVAFKGARRARPTTKRTDAEAKKFADGLAAQLQKDPKKWDEVVAKNSDGPGAKRGGKLGVWRKGRMRLFDDHFAKLKVGQVSKAVKTPFGYHIFLRTAVPAERSGSHILISYKGATRARPWIKRTKDEAKKLATELANALKKDPKQFEQLALKNSDGPTARYGGDLGIWRKA